MDPEVICELPMLEASFRRIEPRNGEPFQGFRIRFRPTGHAQGQIDVSEADANQFAAELDALAALIRARLLRMPQRP